jgi:hypothetical protein
MSSYSEPGNLSLGQRRHSWTTLVITQHDPEDTQKKTLVLGLHTVVVISETIPSPPAESTREENAESASPLFPLVRSLMAPVRTHW